MLLAGSVGGACAQSIYACVDAKGRRLTSDRPIAECMDRPQKELSPSGTVRRVVPPPMTADERAAAEEKARKLAEEKLREDEERRRNRALLARYPDAGSHERERVSSLKLVDDAIAIAQKRAVDLDEQQKKLALETEFYKGDAARMPQRLRKQIEENAQHLAAQKRFIAERQEEKKRINVRFDQELARLKQLWVGQRGPASRPVAVPTPRASSSAAR